MGLGLVLAATAMVVGVLWDISWDASIGADSFWCPPHMAINFGAVAAGGLAAVRIVSATRGSEKGPRGSGRMSLPVGAGIVLWGAVAMLGWMLLDDWWAEAYGLYGERWSPPEILFTAAALAILFGTASEVASSAKPDFPGPAAGLFRWSVGLMLALAVVAMTPFGLPNFQRTATFYTVAAGVFPAVLAWASRAQCGGPDRRGSGATASALFYATLVCALIWTLPRFSASPEIGPIYQPIEVFLPPSFPLLLFLPALAIDASVRRLDSDWVRAVGCGALFVIVFLPTQWLFSAFLLSPASDNWFFAGGGRHWPFYLQVGEERSLFWGMAQDPVGTLTPLVCVVVAVLSARLGLALGSWTAGLRR